MTRIKFWSEPDRYGSDGVTELKWVQPTDSIRSFPHRVTFTLNDIEWYMELNVLPGRFGDRLHMYLMKIEDNTYYPMLDISLNEGLQININNELLIYPFDIDPVFNDLYIEDTENSIQGTYKIGMAAYV